MPQLQTGTYRGEITGHTVSQTPKAGIPCAYITIKVDKGVQSDGVEYDFPEPQTHYEYATQPRRSTLYHARPSSLRFCWKH